MIKRENVEPWVTHSPKRRSLELNEREEITKRAIRDADASFLRLKKRKLRERARVE